MEITGAFHSTKNSGKFCVGRAYGTDSFPKFHSAILGVPHELGLKFWKTETNRKFHSIGPFLLGPVASPSLEIEFNMADPQALNIILVLYLTNHREHTILLSRERVNKETKRMNRLPLSPLVISFILRDFTAKTVAYKSCVTLKRYLSALSKKFFVLIKFDNGGNSLPKKFERTPNNRSAFEVFENKFGQVVEKPFELILCLFGFLKATKFRDSS